MRTLRLVARRPAILRLRLPPFGLARRCSSATTGAILTPVEAATVSSSTAQAPGPILIDSALGVVPTRPTLVVDSAAGVVPAAGMPSSHVETTPGTTVPHEPAASSFTTATTTTTTATTTTAAATAATITTTTTALPTRRRDWGSPNHRPHPAGAGCRAHTDGP